MTGVITAMFPLVDVAGLRRRLAVLKPPVVLPPFIQTLFTTNPNHNQLTSCNRIEINHAFFGGRYLSFLKINYLSSYKNFLFL